jgi:hypothetical protein
MKNLIFFMIVIMLQSCGSIPINYPFYTAPISKNIYRFTAGPDVLMDSKLEWRINNEVVSKDFSFTHTIAWNGSYEIQLYQEVSKGKKALLSHKGLFITSSDDWHSICKCGKNIKNTLWADFSYRIDQNNVTLSNNSKNVDGNTEYFYSCGYQNSTFQNTVFTYEYSSIYPIKPRITSKSTGLVYEIIKYIDMSHLPVYVPPPSESSSSNN